MKAPTPLAYWHRLPGVCNHLASEIGGECGRPDSGTWVPLYPAAPADTVLLGRVREIVDEWEHVVAPDGSPADLAIRRIAALFRHQVKAQS